MDNPIYNGGGKGSNPRNCHTPKIEMEEEGKKKPKKKKK